MIQAKSISEQYKKPAIAPVTSGDTVRVHQLIREGGKQRIQVFEGVVIRTDRMNEMTASMTVRRIASGVGVEKSFLLHSPNVSKVEIIRRAKVRRNYLSYLRQRRGKSARLTEQGFDKLAVNAVAQDKASEPEVDADTAETELDADQVADAETQVVKSTEELSKEENRAAAAEEPTKDEDAKEDEAQLENDETQAGVDKAGQAG